MPKPVAVTIEQTPKRTFASALDWPGWSRSGKDEALALEALASYAPRYAQIAGADDRRFAADVRGEDLEVVERTEGSSGTEFGAPSKPTEHDRAGLDADEAARRARLVEAAWAFFDRTAAG